MPILTSKLLIQRIEPRLKRDTIAETFGLMTAIRMVNDQDIFSSFVVITSL
jgi:hypothetical protein